MTSIYVCIGFSRLRDHLEDLSTDVKIILKSILKKSAGRSWNGLIWLRIGISDGIFLVNDQRDAQILFYVFIFIYNSLHISSTSCSSSGETNCVNTTSGNCHSVSVVVSRAGWKFTPNLHTTRPPTH